MTAQDSISDLDAAIADDLGPWDYATAGIIFVAAIVIGRLLQFGICRVVARTHSDSFIGDLFGRLANYLTVAVGLIYALESLGIAVAPVLGALGIAGIALAFALQDILENFVAGVIIQIRRPFNAGDEIQSGDHEGTITAVDSRTVTILTPDGETIRLPSAQVIKNPIINHSQNGRRRTTLDVGVAYGTDLGRAVSVAREATQGVQGVLVEPPPEALVHTFGESSIDIAVRFWHEPEIATRWRTRDAVAVAVAEAFEREGIEIPFPQRVLHTVPVNPGGSTDD